MAALVTAVGTGSFLALPAAASPGDTSAASAKFLGGSLLLNALQLDDVAELFGTTAANAGNSTADIQNTNLDLAALQARLVTIPGGVTLTLGDFLKLGAVNQHSEAADGGVSRAASGAVSNAGIVDTTGGGSFPADATLDLTKLLGSTVVLDQASLNFGALTGVAAYAASASAAIAESCVDISDPQHCRDYNIVSGKLALRSPTVAGLTGVLVGAGGVSSKVDAAVGTLTGPNGLLAGVLAGLDGALSVLLGNPGMTVQITTNIAGALNAILDAPLGDGVVTINLRTGAIEVDLDALLRAETGNGLSQLDPNTEVLSSEVLSALVLRVGALLNTLPNAVDTTVDAALRAATLVISANICILGTGPSCSTPLLDIGTGIHVDVNGTLAQVLNGTATASITVKVAGLSIPVSVATLLGALAGPLTSTLFSATTGVVGTVTADVTSAVSGVILALGPVLRALNLLASVKANVQELGVGTYRTVALRATVGDLVGAGGVATVDLGRAEVGPNALDGAPQVTGLSPVSGPETGGTIVTVTGSGFTGATGVSFNGVPGTAFAVVDDTTITVASPPHAPGAVDVVVQHPGGNSVPALFTYTPVTKVTGVNPGSGPESGNTTVTISGSCFTGATGVFFGAAPATSFTVVSDTQITAVTPAGTSLVDVVVVGNASCGTGVIDDGFQYVPDAPPTVSSLTPDHGPEVGGTVVTITGSGFIGATGATFDGTSGTAFAVDSDTQITVTSPAHFPGPVDVVVQHPGGNAQPLEFFYDLPIVGGSLTSLTPKQGPEYGGTLVTLTGTDFLTATGVTFDGVAGTVFTVVSNTQITVRTPAHTPGLVDVVVKDPTGDSSPLTFTFLPQTKIDSIVPNRGPEAGGTTVVITGHCFLDATAVAFRYQNAVSFTVDSDTQITAVTPPGVGLAPVEVRGASACGTAIIANGFTYVPLGAPIATSLAPTSGPELGGTVVTITGSGFTGATGVTFGGASGTVFAVVNDTTITVTSPVHAPAMVDVVVQHPLGAAVPLNFTFTPVTKVTGVTPGSGPEAGGTPVTITGSCFTGATGVFFGAAPATSVVVVNDTQITAVTPAGTSVVDVVVTGSVSCGTGTIDDAFQYVPLGLPIAQSLTPDHGPEAGGTVVTITGSGFIGATGAAFDGSPGTIFAVVSDTTITVTSPAHFPGSVNVIVQHPAGNALPLDFFYDLPIVGGALTSLTPNQGPETGGTAVTITGTDLLGSTGATFGGVAGAAFTVVDDTRITVTSPAHAPGLVAVVVAHPTGDTSLSFTFLAVTTIDDVDPDTGPERGGTTVIITGHCFLGATNVLFGTTSATSFTVISDTQITAVAPAGTGVVDVTVVGSLVCGSGTVDDGFRYTSSSGVSALIRTGGGIPVLALLAAALLMASGFVISLRRRWLLSH